MELALRHHLINVTEHVVFTVIAEATRPFDITESNMSFLQKGTAQFLIDQGPYMQGYRSVQLLTESIFRDAPVETSFVDTGIQIKNPYNC